MTDLDQHLQMAIQHYQELLVVLTTLTEPGCIDEGRDLAGVSARLVACQVKAQKADRELMQVFDQSAGAVSLMPTLREYRELLVQVAERNQLLLDRARTYRALVSAELAEIRGGKAAVAGYRLSPESRGGRLSESY